MAVYNGARYLRQAVESILNQTYSDFEFLIFDDGSTDDSLEILNSYLLRDSRIRIVSQANRGLTITLNLGIAEARGRLLARMDCDDIALPHRLQKQVSYLQAHPQCVLVGSRVMLVDPDGLPIREICDLQSHEKIDAALLSHGWPLVHPAVMMRTDSLRAMGGYDEKYRTNQDHDLFLRLAEHGQIANLPDLLLHYRQHSQSISMRNLKKREDPLADILRQAYYRRGMTAPVKDITISKAPIAGLDFHHNWAWTALLAGHVNTARKHALATLAHAPLSSAAWRMMYCAIRGR
jgi:glycosyltransferase involved in cell wall biosynthesis